MPASLHPPSSYCTCPDVCSATLLEQSENHFYNLYFFPFYCIHFFSGLQPTFRLRLPRSFLVAAMCSWRQRLEAGRPARSAFRSFKLCTNRGGMLPLGQQLEKVGGSKRQRKLNVRAIANAGPDCSVTPSCNLRSAACARPVLSWMVQLNPSGVNMRLRRAIGFTSVCPPSPTPCLLLFGRCPHK